MSGTEELALVVEASAMVVMVGGNAAQTLPNGWQEDTKMTSHRSK